MLNVKLQNRGRRRKKQSLGPSSVALLFLASAACDKDPFSPLPASLTTDASAYSAAPGPSFGAWREYTVTITARFTNASPYTVHIARCASSTRYPIYSILHVGSAEVAAYNPGWACVGGYYVHVAPGATRTDTLPISAPWGVDGNTGVPRAASCSSMRCMVAPTRRPRVPSRSTARRGLACLRFERVRKAGTYEIPPSSMLRACERLRRVRPSLDNPG